MHLAFGLFILSVALVWLPARQRDNRLFLSPWLCAAILASLVAFVEGYVSIVGLAELVAFGMACYVLDATRLPTLRRVSGVVVAVLALALATHRLPGFDNPVVWAGVHFSAGAVPVTQYINYDKGMAGLLLLAIVAPRCRSLREYREAFRKSCLSAIVTIVAVWGVAAIAGIVCVEPKWSPYAMHFLLINLFVTCVAEEAFFRGFVQDRLHAALGSSRRGAVVATATSGLLFGAAHLGGGMSYAALASLAGIGYASVYARSKRIEPAILTHFGLNAAHFLFFTYPFLQKG